MKKNELIKILTDGGIEKNEAKAEIELVLEFTFNKTKEELIFIDEFNKETVLPILEKRINTKKPIQYILGAAPFMGEKFIINENVLIPRDDTEILVQEVIKNASKTAKILDIGCGSGIISLMLAKKLEGAKVTGVDISDGAILISNKNKEKLNLKNVIFKKSDLFSNIDEKFDIIVSNPPYIPVSYKKNIQKEVTYEPDLALYTNDLDGLYFYKKIIKEAPRFLNKSGVILFEMMIGQKEGIKNLLFENNFSDIETIKDVQGIDRVIKAKKAA